MGTNEDREKRLAEALRANLRRRKEQQREAAGAGDRNAIRPSDPEKGQA